jgi:hypothetical protein
MYADSAETKPCAAKRNAEKSTLCRVNVAKSGGCVPRVMLKSAWQTCSTAHACKVMEDGWCMTRTSEQAEDEGKESLVFGKDVRRHENIEGRRNRVAHVEAVERLEG